MTNSIKISQLPAATTPLTGAEDVALVQDGVTKQATVTQIGTVTATGSTTARTLANRFADVVNVKDFGAVGDGVTDDTAAIQAAITYANGLGGTVYFPAATYKTTQTLVIDNTLDTLNYRKTCLIGDSPSSVRIRGAAGNFDMIAILGGTGAGAHSHQVIRGLFLQKDDLLGALIVMDNVAFISFEDMAFEAGLYGIYGTDVLSSVFYNCNIRFSNYGVRFEYNNFSRPNAITFVGSSISNHYNYGLLLVGGATFNMFGGSIEGNGIGGADVNKYGAHFVNSGVEGAVSANFSGVYFEGNKGTADIWFANSVDSVAASISGCSFNRINSTDYTTHNIYIETAGAGINQVANISGCGFKGFNDYSPDAARKYINAVSSTGGENAVTWTGCYFQSSTETPTIPNGAIIRDVGQSFYKATASLISDYADDAAAAAGGVSVGGFYRTGSALKMRVA
jgi:hypothetical protein